VAGKYSVSIYGTRAPGPSPACRGAPDNRAPARTRARQVMAMRIRFRRFAVYAQIITTFCSSMSIPEQFFSDCESFG
jgi:hypothetical protein